MIYIDLFKVQDDTMYFDLDEFLTTLKGLTREQSSNLINLKRHELAFDVSPPKPINGKIAVFRNFKSEINFLNKLGIEVSNGLAINLTGIDRIRIDNVIRNLRI